MAFDDAWSEGFSAIPFHVHEASEPCLWIKIADELDRVPAPPEDLLTGLHTIDSTFCKAGSAWKHSLAC